MLFLGNIGNCVSKAFPRYSDLSLAFWFGTAAVGYRSCPCSGVKSFVSLLYACLENSRFRLRAGTADVRSIEPIGQIPFAIA